MYSQVPAKILSLSFESILLVTIDIKHFSPLLFNYLMWLHELAVSDSLCRPCAGNCSPDVEVLVRALRSRLGRLNLVYVYISGQTNCSGFARRKKKPPSDLFLLVTMSGKIGEMKRGKGGLLSCVWITANCLDEERLMPRVIIFFFHLTISFSFPLHGHSFSIFMLLSLSTFLFDFYLSSFLSLVLPYLSVLFLSSFFAVPYVCLNRLASPFLSLVWDQWHLMLSTLPD